MRFSVSNIALPPGDHEAEFRALPDLGFEGLEVAPSRIWADTWRGLTSERVAGYRRQVVGAGLEVVGLHSLFFDQPALGLFRDSESRSRTMDFPVHLSAVCRDLGGRTLIYWGGRKRGDISAPAAIAEAVAFCGELCRHIEDHGTCFCFEPLAPKDTDFIKSAFESLEIVEAVNHPALRVQLDAKALTANDEVEAATFQAVAGYLVHFHTNQPDLGELTLSGTIDHVAMGELLRGIGYQEFVSAEQRMMNDIDPLEGLARSADVLAMCYR